MFFYYITTDELLLKIRGLESTVQFRYLVPKEAILNINRDLEERVSEACDTHRIQHLIPCH